MISSHNGGDRKGTGTCPTHQHDHPVRGEGGGASRWELRASVAELRPTNKKHGRGVSCVDRVINETGVEGNSTSACGLSQPFISRCSWVSHSNGAFVPSLPFFGFPLINGGPIPFEAMSHVDTYCGMILCPWGQRTAGTGMTDRDGHCTSVSFSLLHYPPPLSPQHPTSTTPFHPIHPTKLP